MRSYQCGAGVLLAGFLVFSAELPKAERVIREETIAELSGKVPAAEWELVVSKDNAHVAWGVRQGEAWTVFRDGSAVGGPYRKVSGLAFGVDNRLAWSAQLDDGWAAFLDGKRQGGGFKQVQTLFNGSRFMMFSKEQDGFRYSVEGAPARPAYKEVGAPRFSQDGRHFAYIAKKGKDFVMVTDGVEGPAYAEITSSPWFRKTSTLPVYSAKSGKEWVLVDEGKTAPLSGSKYGYALAGLTPVREIPIVKVYDGDASRFEFGGRKGPAFLQYTTVQFSPDEQHFVYATAQKKGSSVSADRALGQVVVDGGTSQSYEAAPLESAGSAWLRAAGGGALALKPGLQDVFTPNRQGVSTPAVRWDGLRVAYSARVGKQDFTVISDGKPGPHYSAVPCAPVWHPDGSLFYGAAGGGKLAVIVDGEKLFETPLPDGTWTEDKDACSEFRFGRVGHYGFHVMLRSELVAVTDGRAARFPAAMLTVDVPAFEAEKEFHYGFIAKWKAEDLGFSVIVDGLEGRKYEDVWPDSFRWLAGGEFSYVARKGGKIVRVTEKIGSGM